MWNRLKDEANRGALTFIGAGLASTAAAVWAVFVYFDGKESEVKPSKVLACTYTSIKELGWSGGHKTNFCVSNGYREGNSNPRDSDHQNGGICMSGEARICEASAFGSLPKGYACEPEGNRTVCYKVE